MAEIQNASSMILKYYKLEGLKFIHLFRY